MDDKAKRAEIGKLVKKSRQDKGFTQQEVADLSGISLRSIQRIEMGEVLPRYFTLKILASHLGFSAEQLRYEDIKEIKQNTPAPAGKKSPSRARRIITSILSAVILILLAGAFLAQSAKFPETEFEMLLFLAGVTTVYGLILFRVWK